MRNIPGISKTENTKNLIQHSSFVCVTLGSTQRSELASIRSNLQFDLIVIDEAGQANFVEILFPLYFTSLKRLLLVGDPFQLGPTYNAPKLAISNENDTQTFVRIIQSLSRTCPGAIHQLRRQFRMRPLVAYFVNQLVYSKHDQLLTTSSRGSWKKTDDLPAFLMFSGDSWQERRIATTFSCQNENEGKFGLALLEKLLE